MFSSILPVDNVDANVLKTPKHIFLKSPAIYAAVVAVLGLTWSSQRGLKKVLSILEELSSCFVLHHPFRHTITCGFY